MRNFYRAFSALGAASIFAELVGDIYGITPLVSVGALANGLALGSFLVLTWGKHGRSIDGL